MKRKSAETKKEAPKRRPTLKEVAKAAGVSLASASYAVNGTGSIGAETREHVVRVAATLGYRQNMSARAVRTGKTGTIGLVLPDLTNPFFPLLAQSVIQTARQYGHSVFVTDSERSQKIESESIQLLVQHGVDGVIWFPLDDKSPVEPVLMGVPTVVIDRAIPGFESIQADYANGGRLAAEHLVAAGHRSIGIIRPSLETASLRQRCDAAAHYIQEHAKLAFRVVNAHAVDLESPVKDAIRSKRATAVFVGCDLIAIGVMQYAQSLKIKVPQQLSIVGFDDLPLCDITSPPLTSIGMPVSEMAAEAVASLLRSDSDRGGMRRRIVFETSLVERASVARIKR